MTNYPKLSAENNSALDAAFAAWARQNDPRMYPAERQAFEAGWGAAQQDAVPADEWLRQMDALVDAHDEERKTGTAAGRVKARAAIKAHARRRIEPASQDTSMPSHGWKLGNLLTHTQDDYPGLGAWFGQIWEDDDVVARVYGKDHKQVSERAGRLLSAPAAQQDASAAQAVPMELRGVRDALANGGGFWRSCTGCHESNEGHDTGPHSKIFGCALGVGCSECGGIGAVWDDTDYVAMGDAMARGVGQEVAANPSGQAQAAPEPRCLVCRDSGIMGHSDLCVACDGAKWRDEEEDQPSEQAQQPASAHPDDLAVDRFTVAMKAKLAKKRAEGRGGWEAMTAEALSALLHEHVAKGDPLDVGNIAMMLHQSGQSIVADAAPASAPTNCCRKSPCEHPGVGPCDMPYRAPAADAPKGEPSDREILELFQPYREFPVDWICRFARDLLARYAAPLDAAAMRKAALEDLECELIRLRAPINEAANRTDDARLAVQQAIDRVRALKADQQEQP